MAALHSKRLLAAALFVGSTLVLAMQLINPSPLVVAVGEGGTNTAELGEYFRYTDVGIITVAAVLLGTSGTYLLVGEEPTDDDGPSNAVTEPGVSTDGRGDVTPSDELLEARRNEWEETAERLANKEQKVYTTVLDADGVCPQSDIVDETDLSKASVSRALDSLETKNLVERKRRGMGNMVLLL